MAGFRVNEAICKRDGICALVCPARIIEWEAGALPCIPEKKENRCIRCGQCMAFCPACACSAPGIGPRSGGVELPLINHATLPSPEAVEELLFSRRSVRNFRKTLVAYDMLIHLADVTRFAPTAKNSQSLRWVVVEDREKMERLAGMTVEWLEALPNTDPGLAETMHSKGMAAVYRSGYDIIFRGAPHMLIALGPAAPWAPVDAAIALTYLEIAAASRGIGACWAGYFTIACGHAAAGKIREALGLREGERMCGAQMLGYPKFKVTSRPWRKPLDITRF